MAHGKKYRAAAELIDATQIYSLAEGVALAKKTSHTAFDATVEMHIRTSSNPKHADQIIRSTITLPHGTGKSLRIAAFCEGDDAVAAKKAGADVVGGSELVEEILAGTIDFEVTVATPSMMKTLAKAAKILGSKGLMPSPKRGTVTPKIADAIADLKKGKMEFRTDKEGIIHTIVGKASFSETQLLENITTFLKALKDNRPSGIKGQLIKNISLSTSMGPGLFVAEEAS